MDRDTQALQSIMKPAELLSKLIGFNTTNPPGNELEAILFVKDVLDSAGVDSILVSKDPKRPNLIARIKGDGAASPLLFYGHMDVVTAKGQPWDKPPFMGLIEDGWVWGRGALDMKSGLAMMIVAALRTLKSGHSAKGDIILAILSDEEHSSHFGAKYLVAEHGALFEDVSHAIGEFGGFPLYFGDKTFYAIQVGEKQGCTIRAIFRGAPGHGSQPIRNGAMTKLGSFLTKLDSQPFPTVITPITRMMIESIVAALPPNPSDLISQTLIPERTKSTLAMMGGSSRLFWPMFHNTVSPTVVKGSDKINVIPAEVTLDMDVRLLPEQQPEDALETLRSIATVDTEFQVLRFEKCPPMPDMSLFPLLSEILSELDKGACSTPYLLSGITDARVFSQLGIQTYGYLPMNLPRDFDFFSSVHGANERIPAESVEFGARAMEALMARYNST